MRNNHPCALCHLVAPDPLAFWRHTVARWSQDAIIEEIANLGWLASVGFRGNLVEASPNSGALISTLVPCKGVWLPVTLAVYCYPRG